MRISGPTRRAPLSKWSGPPLATAALCAAALLAGMAASAQQAPEREPARPPPSGNSGIEEIIVKGSSQGIEDFSAADSVTAFDASDLQALGAQDITDIAAFTPNLEIVTSGSTTPAFFIRGVGLNDFNANATSSVAVYQDDVNLNAQGLQLGTIFDLESVNVLRGPQGTGLARNSSAGAIKLYSRKPTGQLSGFLTATAGNYEFQDYQGAIEAPLWKDVISGRLAFRYSDREGFMKNRCGGLRAERISNQRPYIGQPVGTCRTAFSTTEPGRRFSGSDSTNVPIGLPRRANDLHNWAVRGTLRFEPTLDNSWILGAQYRELDQTSTLGQAYGSFGGLFGTNDVQGYRKPEVSRLQLRKLYEIAAEQGVDPSIPSVRNALLQPAIVRAASELAQHLDDDPYKGYYNRVGPTRNDVLNTYVRGEILLPWNLELFSVTGYNEYERLIDVDLDFSPTVLGELEQDDELYQVSQDLSLAGDLGALDPLTWEIGGFALFEYLDAHQDITLRQDTAAFQVSDRKYRQKITSLGAYASFSRDFWRDFTLDGGVRFNWEAKSIDMKLLIGANNGPDAALRVPTFLDGSETFHAPTGTLKLSYRFSEDTRLYWKYTRGWKAGHFNATAPLRKDGISVAEPEKLDAFETGMLGSWFNGALMSDFSLFYYAYDNYQLFTIQTDFGTLPAFVVLNVDKAEVYGAELDLVARPWPGAFAEVRGGWLESRFVDFVLQNVEQRRATGGTEVITLIREVDATGNRLLNSPQFKVSATVEQDIPLGHFGGVRPRYDVVWTSETFYDITEGSGVPNFEGNFIVPKHTFSQQAFFLHHARISYAPPSQNPVISFWVRNIEDKRYRTLGADATVFLGTTLHFIGEPRTYGVDVLVNF